MPQLSISSSFRYVLEHADQGSPIGDSGWLAYLESLSDELDRPIRFIGGNARLQDPARTDWGTGEVGRVEGLTRERASERGITINTWGNLTRRRTWRNITNPVEAYDIIEVGESDFEPIEYDGVMIGEFTERVITYHVPLESFGTALRNGYRESFDLDQLFGEAIRSCVDPDFLASRAERQAARNRDTFLELATTRDTQAVQSLRSTISESIENITNYEAYIAQQERNLEDSRSQLDAVLSRRENPDPDALLLEWANIEAHAQVREARWQGHRLHVLTDALTMTDPRDGRECEVGEFDLTFDFNTNTMNVHNLTNRRNGWDHPHVERGNMCHGALRNTVRTLFERREIGAIVNLTIDMLEHVTPDDAWGRNVQWWYDAEDAPEPETQDPANL